MKNTVIVVVILVLTLCSCAPKVDINAEKALVRALVDSLETANETNNLELLARLFSHSPDNIVVGTDAAERFIGFDQFMDAQKRAFASIEKGSQVTMREVAIGMDRSGDAAWLSCLWDWQGTSQGEAFAFENLRLTAVLEKQNGKWTIVHLHASVPVSGQAVKY